jgi:enamine deaminase RidA (YjgF/YER057c/UK114 family)
MVLCQYNRKIKRSWYHHSDSKYQGIGDKKMAKRRNMSSGTIWEDKVGYSRAVRVGDLIYVSGTTATDDEGNVVGDNAYEQSKFIFEKIEHSLHAVGAEMRHVVRTTMYVTDASMWEDVGRAHNEFFADIRPVSTLVEVSALIGEAYLVEIAVDAVIYQEK